MFKLRVMASVVRPLPLILTLVLSVCVATAELPPNGGIKAERFDLSRTVQKIAGRRYFDTHENDKKILLHHMSEQWLAILRESSEWVTGHCMCQFAKSRWNGTSTSWKKYLLRAHPEAGYFRAALSASLVFHTARHCAMGKISCYLGNTTEGGHPSQIEYTMFFNDFAKKQSFCDYHFTEGLRAAKILDVVDKYFFAMMNKKRRWSKKRDLLTHYHNNAVGREKIKDIRPHLHCYCTGPSGSCILKTCSYVETKRMLTRTALALHEQYTQLLAGGAPAIASARKLVKSIQRGSRTRGQRNITVIASRPSPSYCRPSKKWGILGPGNRICYTACGRPNGEHFGDTSHCQDICCGRSGSQVTEYACNCRMQKKDAWVLVCQSCSREVTACLPPE